MKILDRFHEEIKPLNKMDFMKVLLKYKVVNNMGNINDWLKQLLQHHNRLMMRNRQLIEIRINHFRVKLFRCY